MRSRINFPVAALATLLVALPGISFVQAPVNPPAAIVTPTDTDVAATSFHVADEAAFFSLMNLDAPDMAAVKSAVEARDWPRAKQAWADHLRNRTSPQWFWSYRDKNKIARLLEEEKQPLKGAVRAADAEIARKFNFLGVPKTLEKSPEWKQGVNEWTSVINRFPFFIDEGRAYWATGDPKYAQDFVYLTRDWIAKNPVPEDAAHFGALGTPWRSLEDGLRTENWLEAMQFFMDSPDFDAETKYLMTRSFVEHARYLCAVEVDHGFRAGNWQIIESTGLGEIGMMFPEFRESASWRAQAFQVLAEHMDKDVYPDGGSHELTTGYHMAVTDQFLAASVLAKKNGYDPAGLTDRHAKMYEWIMDLSTPDRVIPGIGDGGYHDVQPVMADGALLYNRPDFRFWGGKEGPVKWIWTFGADGYALPAAKPAYTSRLLPDSQYATMRTGWEKDDRYLLFDMAPWGGGHSHDDQLQVIAYAGRPLLVDPGQYGYDEPLANKYFRTTQAHNVLMVDGRELGKGDPRVLAWQTTPDADFAAGSLTTDTWTQQRSVLFVKPDYWLVVDRVQGVGANAQDTHQLTRLFHFARKNVIVDGDSVRSDFGEGQNIEIRALDGAPLEMMKGWIPTGAATAVEVPVASYTAKTKLPATLVTLLTPFSGTQDLPKAEWIPGDDAHVTHLRLTFTTGDHDEILIADQPMNLQIGAAKGFGRALYIRSRKRGDSKGVVGADIAGAKP